MLRKMLRPGDVAVLDVLEDGPHTSREVWDLLHRRVWEAWAEEVGVEIEWGSESEPLGARLIAWNWARGRSYPYLSRQQVDYVLRKLERHGDVQRIAVPGHRGTLWLHREASD